MSIKEKLLLFIDSLIKLFVGNKAQQPTEDSKMNKKEIANIPKFKDKSENVKIVQEALVKLGYKIAVDGIFGEQTKKAISSLQKDSNLAGSGAIGEKTLTLLNIKLKQVDTIKLLIPSSSKEYNKKIIIGASKEVGVKESAGKANNARVVEYHKFSTKANKYGADDSVPWCSSFVCFIVENFCGVESTNSMLARSWEKWALGKKIEAGSGMAGDVVVFWRTSLKSGYGHVGLFLKETKDHVWVLGGNQSDEVNISRYSKERLRGYYRHVGDASNKEELASLANKIMNGQKVSLDTKVV